MTTVATIAAAIREAHPAEELFAGVLADEIATAAEAQGLPIHAALLYVNDRPTRQLSAPDFLRWCDRYAIAPPKAP